MISAALAVHAHARGLLLSEGWGRIWTRYNSMAYVGNPATILLVDDDEALRRFARRILMQKGFHVIGTYDGAEALQDAYAQPVDLLLTDPIPIARQEWTCEVACLRPR